MTLIMLLDSETAPMPEIAHSHVSLCAHLDSGIQPNLDTSTNLFSDTSLF